MSKNIRSLGLLFVVAVGVSGCGLFSDGSSDAEMVFAASEVGTPEGPNVTKNIGAEGGTLASADGRMTLTVPPNALTETIAFSIQPITNNAANGIGLAYRLEPGGKTFVTPLQISVRYGDRDLEGTVPEALTLAYQDKQGAWHSPEATIDQNAKILTVSTSHFTDWSFLSRLRIAPDKATLRVGEKLQMQLTPCHHQSNFSNRLKRFIGGVQVCELTNGKYYFDLQPNWFADVGAIDTPREIHVVYTAPPKKPSPNIATITIPFEFESRGDTYAPPHRGMLISRITIVDKGYKATGKTADVTYSGTVCSLEQPFTVNGSVIGYKFEFKPTSAKAGTVTISAAGMMVTAEGGGSYSIEGSETDTPRIAVSATVVGHSPVGSRTGSGIIYIDLLPVESGECE